jgi:hypothetical protein
VESLEGFCARLSRVVPDVIIIMVVMPVLRLFFLTFEDLISSKRNMLICILGESREEFILAQSRFWASRVASNHNKTLIFKGKIGVCNLILKGINQVSLACAFGRMISCWGGR